MTAWVTPPPHDVRSGVIVVTDETTKAEIAEAIAHLRTAYKRGPQGRDWQEQHHRRLDVMLDDWLLAPE